MISYKFTYNIVKYFQVNLIFGLDLRNNRQEVIERNELQISKDAIAPGAKNLGSISKFLRNFIIFVGELNAQHKFTFKESFSFITKVGDQFFRNDDFQKRIIAEGVTDCAITLNIAEYLVDDLQRGFFNFGVYILENIGLQNKIFFNLGLRIDGNTAFGDEIGFLYLPKFGVNYNVSDKEFWTNIFTNNTLSSLKLRANWGQATNFSTPFAGELTVATNNFLGQQSFTFNNRGNTSLTSKTATTMHFGINLGMFDKRIR
jgi:hypothetical protein